MLIFLGCVQGELAPDIDLAAARVMAKLGISLIPVNGGGCCGAMSYHLADHVKAQAMARHNIDACWAYLEQGIEAIVSTASGCGVMLKDYDELLEGDTVYAEKAVKIAALTRDLVEILSHEAISELTARKQTVVFQAPCTLQHGQQLAGSVEALLQKAGFDVKPVSGAHLCCGSAGTYSLLQTRISAALRTEKIKALEATQPDCIVTANIGCMMHLQAVSTVPVKHWIELFSDA